MNLQIVAWTIFGWVALQLLSGLFGANVRRLAAELGWDAWLLRTWNLIPAALRNMLPAWQPLQQRWWLWLFLGLSGGLALALTVSERPQGPQTKSEATTTNVPSPANPPAQPVYFTNTSLTSVDKSSPLVFSGLPSITADKLRFFVDLVEYSPPRWPMKPWRAQIGELKDVVRGIWRSIPLVSTGGNGQLRWGPSEFQQDIRAPQAITLGSFGVTPAVPIRMRVVIIGPNNEEQYFYSEILEVQDNPNHERFIVLGDPLKPAWAAAWENP